MFKLLAIVLTFLALHAHAEVPREYKPIIVKPPFSRSERVIDLSVAVEKANRENKPLYIYLGASDCPPCREYQTFLTQNLPELKEAFDEVIVVDIRTRLNGPDLVFKVGKKRYSFEEFKTLVGDSNKILTYPYFWYISPTLKQVKQLPQGSRNYLQVAKQIAIFSRPKTPQASNPAAEPADAR